MSNRILLDLLETCDEMKTSFSKRANKATERGETHAQENPEFTHPPSVCMFARNFNKRRRRAWKT